MRRIGLIGILVVVAFICFNCSTDLSGGTTSTENGKVMGVVKNELDSVVSNCEVTLLPSNYNPLLDSINNFYKDTTDLTGVYEFNSVESGDYNLICKDSNMSILIDVKVNNNTIYLNSQILKPVTSLKVKISGDMPFMNYAYFQGTPFVAEFDSTDSTLYFDALPYGVMPDLILQNNNDDEIIKEGIEISSGQIQSIDIDTNSFIVDNRFIGSGVVISIDASFKKKWAGLADDGLYFSGINTNYWNKTDTGASPWLQDSILQIEANEHYEKDWALIKTKYGTLLFENGTYWSVGDQLYPSVKGKIPESMLISDYGDLILSYDNRTIMGKLVDDTLIDFNWDYVLSGGYSHLAGRTDSLYLVKNGAEIYRRFNNEQPYLYYTMSDSITGLSMIDNELYIGCAKGFYKYDFSIDSLYMISIEASTDNVRSIIKDATGTIYALVGNRSILYYDGFDCQIYTPKIDSSAVFRDMTFEHTNQLWISAGEHGIFTIQPVE